MTNVGGYHNIKNGEIYLKYYNGTGHSYKTISIYKKIRARNNIHLISWDRALHISDLKNGNSSYKVAVNTYQLDMDFSLFFNCKFFRLTDEELLGLVWDII